MDFRALETPLLTGEVERRELAGRQHLVAPVVLVREMVLNGGYLPAEEIQASLVAWNGRPVTVGHPTKDGDFAPANQPEFLETHTIGRIFDTEFVTDLPDTERAGRSGARANAWVDEQRALDLGGEAAQIAEFLAAHADADLEEEGEAANDEHIMDVSTGYWHDFEERSGTFEGQEFSAVQFDLHPDHLAFLPNQEGACSVKDGCGVPRVQQRLATHSQHYSMNGDTPNPSLYGGGLNAQASPRTPEFGGLTTQSESDWGDVDLSFGAFVEAYAEDNPDATEWDDLSASERAEISARSMNGNPDAEDFEEAVVLPVVVPATNNLHEGGLLAALSRAPQTQGINVDETQSAIRSLLEEHFDREFGDQVAQNLGRRVMDALGLSGAFGPGREGTAVADGGSRNDGHGTNCSCGQHETNTNPEMDIDIDELAEQTAFDAEELGEMEESTLEKLSETVAAQADADTGDGGDSNASTDGGDGSGADAGADNDGGAGDDALTVDTIRDVVRDELNSFKKEERAGELESAVDALKEHSDLDEATIDTLAEQVDDVDALIDLARNVSGDDGSVPKVGAANGVNWLGRGAPSGASENADDEEGDHLEYVGGIGVMNRMQEGDD